MGRRPAMLLLAACTVAQGSIAILVRQVDLSAMSIVCIRAGLGAATIGAIAIALGRARMLRFPGVAPLGLGILVAGQFSLYFAAIQETSVASAVVITYAAPVFIALFAPILLNERLTIVDGGALIVSLGGVGLIALGDGTGEVRTLGVLLALGGALTFALLLVLFKRYAAQLNAVTVVFWELVVAAVVLFPVAVNSSYDSVDAGQVMALVALGALLTGIVTTLFVTALRSVPVTSAGILTYLEPVSAALLAVVLLDERLTLPVIVGGWCIIGSGAVVVLAPRDELGVDTSTAHRKPPPLH